jgi:N-acetylmuramoyl-L-alanine amidase
MKWPIHPVLLAVALFAATQAHGAQRSFETTQISGKAFVRLSDWAKANGFEVRWLRRDETLQLNNHALKVVLTVDSREAQLNGVQVWLSFPLAQRNEAVYIAELDLQTTLQPIVSPPKNRSGIKIKTICLDPGHGGKDPGNHAGANQEKKFTLLLAQEVREQLTRAGLKATLTRTTDTFIELPTRPELARKRNADLFVSLHFNAFQQASVRGAEVYCLTPAGASSTNARGEGAGAGWFAGNRQNDKNMFLAYQMQKALTKNLAVEDRGLKRARYAVLRDAAMPAVLIEGGFMSNPGEGRKIFDAAYRRQMARAIVEGVLAYKRTVEQAG